MIWGTRAHCHVDRAACAWLIRRFIDSEAEFVFADDPEDLPPDAIPFDLRGSELSHHDGRCTFEVMVDRYQLEDPVLEQLGKIVHEADLNDDRYDAPEARGLDVVIRGLSLRNRDREVLAITEHLFDGLYEFHSQAAILGREPA
ncbi:MAG TPA: chromate resistance protein ChrB domain-containing protein [Gaiellaceae bacterium]|nr:chromate resistance protein ChrB domain-containing protein [Gaiellaceae bacterium]